VNKKNYKSKFNGPRVKKFNRFKYLSFVLVFFLLLMNTTGCIRPVEDTNTFSTDASKDIQATTEESSESKIIASDDDSTSVESIESKETEKDVEEPNYTKVDLIMVGDMLLHDPVNESGRYPDGTYNYDHLFTNVKDIIMDKDIAMVNQEVILGGLELGLSGYPTFNGAFEVADSIANTGFNVILHATNHTLDKGKTGGLNCMNYWKSNYPDIAIVGINESQEARDNIYVYEKEDLKIAILNYTYGTNGVKLPSDMPYIVNLLDKEDIERDVKKAIEIADFVIVAPHWGIEYKHYPSQDQIELAEFMADLGVDLVIGTHPHVVQPVEWVESENGNKMLIYYSIGNFINSTSSKGDGVTNRMIGAMAEVTIEKHEREEAFISQYGAIPLISHKDTSGPGLLTVYPASNYTEELARENEIVNQDPNFSLELCLDIWNEVYPNLDMVDIY
jgi:poly-gamma-glutamate capsule biosynthesis protein CapA/YwtB (metallophosphatase superfamily)